MSSFTDLINSRDDRYISSICSSIINKTDIKQSLIDFEREITNRFRINKPDFFDERGSVDDLLYETLNYIISKYNNAVTKKFSISSEFDKIEKIGISKGKKFVSVFGQIGKQLEEGIAPNINQLYLASNLFKGNTDLSSNTNIKLTTDEIKLNDYTLRKMYDWDSKNKILSAGQRNYIAEFAWGLKKLNKFHEKNIRRHLKKLIESGLSI